MAVVYSEEKVREAYRALTRLLIKNGLTISTMESATSGQIASLITDTEGASAILKGAYITYSNEAKIKCGVPEEIIEKYSVYSRETAREMSQACKSAYNADIGIGVTGTMGNIDPENASSSIPGQVFFAIAFNETTNVYYVELPPQKSRLMYKLAVAQEIADRLIPLIE